MRHKRQLLAAIALVVLGACGGLASAESGSAPPGSVPVVVQTDVEPYTAPTGPIISAAHADSLAVAEAVRAGDSTPTVISHMQGTFAETHAALKPDGEILESAETEEWLHSATYLTVMHGHFTARLVAQGATPVTGSVLAVITDAHTGAAEGEYIGAVTPDSPALTPVSAAESDAAVQGAETATQP